MTWTAPITKAGKPCKRCQPGNWCRNHAPTRAPKKIKGGSHGKAPKNEYRRGSYKLDRSVLDAVQTALKGGARSEAALMRAANVWHTTWIAWRDQGQEDAAKNRATMFRELWEVIAYQRRGVAVLADEAVMDAALGIRGEMIDPETGNVVKLYKERPDGRLAMEYVRAVDPDRYHNPRTKVDFDVPPGGIPLRILAFDPKAYPSPEKGKP